MQEDQLPIVKAQGLIAEESALLGTLLDLLETEHATLLGKEPGRITAIAESKASLIDQLETVTRSRTAALEAAGVIWANNTAGDQSLHTSRSGSQELSVAWESLVELTRKCRDLNLINGALINAGQRYLRQTLSILRGEDPNQATVSYSASGHADGPYRPRSLVKI